VRRPATHNASQERKPEGGETDPDGGGKTVGKGSKRHPQHDGKGSSEFRAQQQASRPKQLSQQGGKQEIDSGLSMQQKENGHAKSSFKQQSLRLHADVPRPTLVKSKGPRRGNNQQYGRSCPGARADQSRPAITQVLKVPSGITKFAGGITPEGLPKGS